MSSCRNKSWARLGRPPRIAMNGLSLIINGAILRPHWNCLKIRKRIRRVASWPAAAAHVFPSLHQQGGTGFTYLSRSNPAETSIPNGAGYPSLGQRRISVNLRIRDTESPQSGRHHVAHGEPSVSMSVPEIIYLAP